MIWLTRPLVETLRKGESIVSFDLGRTFTKASFSALEGVPVGEIRGDFIYAWDGKDLYKLAVFAKHFYRLRMLSGKPILEIDGLRMHLSKDFKDVFDYSAEVCRVLKIRPTDSVLDICTGLGYTAITASCRAKSVATIEKSRAVLSLAEWNPWSKELFSSPNICIIRGDAFDEVPKLKGKFTKIIHDPPRMSCAGNLYSAEFYRSLASVSLPGALLFHYFGSLGKRKRRISVEITKRLLTAGWKLVKFYPRLQGCTAKRV